MYIAKTRANVLITSVRIPTARLDMPNTRADICPVLGEIYLYLPIYIIDICAAYLPILRVKHQML